MTPSAWPRRARWAFCSVVGAVSGTAELRGFVPLSLPPPPPPRGHAGPEVPAVPCRVSPWAARPMDVSPELCCRRYPVLLLRPGRG